MAIIGSGPTCLYILKQLSEQSSEFRSHISSIAIFEKSEHPGMGMPYNPETTDFYNLSNISSEEIPLLEESFAQWLQLQPKAYLKKLNITQLPISSSKVYSRLALGAYLAVQFGKLVDKLNQQGINIQVNSGTEVIDIVSDKSSDRIRLKTKNSKQFGGYSKVIIATGHIWADQDRPKQGYYASPWPIHKIIPHNKTYYNFTIGTLGASLSAFDVVSSLAHRHGIFQECDDGLSFKLHEHAQGFKIVMHSAEGWLPHLQYEQEKPMREIYRHTTREELLSLIDRSGFLSLSVFFDKICRPALLEASVKDGDTPLTKLLSQTSFGIKEFIEHMESKHDYVNSFEGMRKELVQANKKMVSDKPTYWMETLDDLMYCVNFHAELISAEDYLFFRKQMMPFLMNVIAALPLPSARILLALYDAGCLRLKTGKVEVMDNLSDSRKTMIRVSNANGQTETIEYSMFINCSGQGSIKFEDYPFPTLLKEKRVRQARSKFETAPGLSLTDSPEKREQLLITPNATYLYTGGIDIDPGYRILDSKGTPSSLVSDVSFVHTSGCRPYSYGLQACHATSVILVEQLKNDFIHTEHSPEISIEGITKIYKKHDDL